MRPEYLRRLYAEIRGAGRPLGLTLFGMRALLCLRLEKNFPTWYRELPSDLWTVRGGTSSASSISASPDFIGRAAALAEKESGGAMRRVSFAVEAADADVLGDEPIWHAGKVIGWITSGGYGHWVERSLAQGYIPAALAVETAPQAFEIEILGDRARGDRSHRALVRPVGRAHEDVAVRGVASGGHRPVERRAGSVRPAPDSRGPSASASSRSTSA